MHYGGHIEGTPFYHAPGPVSFGVAEARGFWPRKRIVVSDNFFRLPPRVQMAVIYHELGHVKHWDMERAVLQAFGAFFRWLVLGPVAAEEYLRACAHAREFRCDAYAAARGYGSAMIAFLRYKVEPKGFDFHPPPEARVKALIDLGVSPC